MKRISVLFSVLLFTALFAFAGSRELPPVRPPFPHERNDLRPDDRAIFGGFENGLRYVYYPNSEPQGRVFMYLFVRAGSLNEKDEQHGIAHFLEHMGFNGSENFAPGALVKYFQEIGMAFGGDINAMTSYDFTAYSLDLPDTSAETIGKGMLLLGDYARRLTLGQDEIDRERGIILAEMRDRDSVGWRTLLKKLAFIYDGALISRRMPIGTRETVGAMNKPLFDDFYHTWYRPERMTLIFVGDRDFETIEPLLAKHFAGLAPGAPARAEPDLGDFDHEGLKIFHYSDTEADATAVELMIARRSDGARDGADRRKREAARELAEAVLNRRLEKLAKTDGAPFIESAAYSYDRMGWAEHAGIYLKGKKENWEKMLATAEQELRRFITYGFTAAEIAEARADFLRRLDDAVLKAPTRQNRAIASMLLGSLSQDRVVLSPEERRRLLGEYVTAVSEAEIMRAFRDAWRDDHLLVTVTGDAQLGPDAEKTIAAAYQKAAAIKLDPPQEAARVEFAYGKGPDEGGTITKREHVPDLDIHQIEFVNGVKLNLKKTDFKKNEINIRLRFGKGSMTQPKDHPGLAKLAELLYQPGGLEKHSIDELRSLLAGKSVNVQVQINPDCFAVVGSTVPKDVETALQLVRAYYLEPGFSGEIHRLVKKQVENQYRSLERNPQGVLQLKGFKMLAGGDARVGWPTPDEFLARTLEELKNWIDNERKTSGVEVAIVGDFDIDEIVGLAARYFGTLPPPTPQPLDPALRKIGRAAPGRTEFRIDTKIERGMLAFFWNIPDAIEDIRRARRIRLLAAVFRERLRMDVREELGGAYSPYAYAAPSVAYEDFGQFAAIISVDPDEQVVAKIAAEVRKIAADLSEKGVSGELFERVRGPYVNQIRRTVRDNEYWMNVLSGAGERPVQLDWARTFIADHLEMTPEDMHKYASEFLTDDKAIVIEILPAK